MPSPMLILVMVVRLLGAAADGNNTYATNQPSEISFHPLAFHMPVSPDDTGIVPAEMLHAMASAEDLSEDFANPEKDAHVASAQHLESGKWTCHGARRRMFSNHMHVYQMRFSGDPKGVEDRDAASLYGIVGLLTGGDPKLPKSQRTSEAWGLNRYYSKGIMQVIYVSYTKFGQYESCNAVQPGVPHSPHHCSPCYKPSTQCCCASSWTNASLGNPPLAGRLKTSYTIGEWYSFNGMGKDKTWHQFECPSQGKKLKDLADKIASEGGCKACGNDLRACATCIRKMKHSAIEKVFHQFFEFPSEDTIVI